MHYDQSFLMLGCYPLVSNETHCEKERDSKYKSSATDKGFQYFGYYKALSTLAGSARRANTVPIIRYMSETWLARQ